MTVENAGGLVPIEFLNDGNEIILAIAGAEPVYIDLAAIPRDRPEAPDVHIVPESHRNRAVRKAQEQVRLGESDTREAAKDTIAPKLRTFKPCLSPDIDPNIFSETDRQHEAIAICGRCTVEFACREEVIAEGRHATTVRGGLTANGLNKIITRRKNAAARQRNLLATDTKVV